MNILFVVNDDYVDQMLVTLNSIFVNHCCKLDIYIITNGLSRDNYKKIHRFIRQRHGGIFFKIYREPCIDIEKMTNKTWNPIVYYKLYGIFDIREVDRILYLDCDIIVDADLSDLYQTDFAGNYAVVIEDSGMKQVVQDYETHLKRIMVKDCREYFNGGVMLLNLKKIQKEMDLEYMVHQFDKYSDLMTFNEQDLLNMVWNSKLLYADKRYNRIASDFSYRKKIRKDKNVAVYHYTTNKPWIDWRKYDKSGYGWCVKKYLQYCDLTETKDLYHRVKRLNKNILEGIIGRLKEILGYDPYFIIDKKGEWFRFIETLLFYRG